MRIFVDANVLFAAAISPDGRSAALFVLAQEGYCDLMTSPHAVSEAHRNLVMRYSEALDQLSRLRQVVAIVPEAAIAVLRWARSQGLPEEDAPILAAAVAARADVLVTGDRGHFGHLFGRTVRGLRVLSLAETLDFVLDQRRRR